MESTRLPLLIVVIFTTLSPTWDEPNMPGHSSRAFLPQHFQPLLPLGCVEDLDKAKFSLGVKGKSSAATGEFASIIKKRPEELGREYQG
jgi:hypothetical protein